MKIKGLLLILCLLSCSVSLYSQYRFEHYNIGNANPVEVFEDAKKLTHAFTGGLKIPVFNAMDLNFDGKQDLVVFEKDGSRIACFINKGIPNTIEYEYAPEYSKRFPKLDSWMLLVDYNQDGKPDIFSAHPAGINVYKNISNQTDGIKFLQVVNLLLVDYISFKSNLPVASNEIPSIVDIDNDGDIDILHFVPPIDSSGESVYWYQNLGMERYNSADSLDFIVGKRCWGLFRESATDCNININYPVGICGSGGKEPLPSKNTIQNMHVGSTSNIFDVTGDGVVDILIGDPSCNNLTLLVNGATNSEAIMTQKIKNFPSSRPINITVYPMAYALDVNNDNLKDIIAVPNDMNNADNTKQVNLLLNNGTVGINRYDFIQDDFLYNEMVDVGDGSSPVFVDYNKDGLMDLLISNHQYLYQSNSTTGLALYKNSGTKSLAKYELISRDWFNFSSLGIKSMAPAFADMDNDGDLDMVCGSADGSLHYFRNTASTAANMNLEYIPNYFNAIDVGNFSSPFVYDFNKDGKMEIVLGEQSDNFNLVENIGSLASPNYVLSTDSLYGVKLRAFKPFPRGKSQLKVVQLRPNENPRVTVSNAHGVIYILDEVSANYNQKMSVAFDSILLYSGRDAGQTGGFNYAFEDLDMDAKPELMVGTPQGGLYLFKNLSLSVGINSSINPDKILVYPNPTSHSFYVQNVNSNELLSIKLLDINAKVLMELNPTSSGVSIDMSQFSNGIYILQAQTVNGIFSEKILKIQH
jgi:hypothetical protein